MLPAQTFFTFPLKSYFRSALSVNEFAKLTLYPYTNLSAEDGENLEDIHHARLYKEVRSGQIFVDFDLTTESLSSTIYKGKRENEWKTQTTRGLSIFIERGWL
jgi:hypothetical protein